MHINIRYKVVLLIFFGIFQQSVFSQNSPLLLKQLSRDADLILTGKVQSLKSIWNENKTRIYTDVTVEVDEFLKGQNTDRTIIIRHPGGEVGEVGELYSHMPKFADNEEVLIFTAKDKNGVNYKVIKGEEGKLTIYNDNKTGEKVTASGKKVSILKNEIRNYVE